MCFTCMLICSRLHGSRNKHDMTDNISQKVKQRYMLAYKQRIFCCFYRSEDSERSGQNIYDQLGTFVMIYLTK